MAGDIFALFLLCGHDWQGRIEQDDVHLFRTVTLVPPTSAARLRVVRGKMLSGAGRRSGPLCRGIGFLRRPGRGKQIRLNRLSKKDP